MAFRSAAISAFVLATALALAQPGRAQGFFSFYEMSPRQIVAVLERGGYELRGPMYRRGGVYVCDVVSVSGRPARLIVDARDGHILERYAVRAPSRDSADAPPGLRPPRNVGMDNWGGEANSRGQMALDDRLNPPSRVYGGDSLFGSWSSDAPAPKPKRHAVKKHKEPSVAKAPSEATTAEKPAANAPSTSAAVAPEPSKPGQDAAKPTAEPAPVQTKAEAEKSPEPKPATGPKPEPQRKKLNDLPVGTLD
jgi:hypothetical protein